MNKLRFASLLILGVSAPISLAACGSAQTADLATEAGPAQEHAALDAQQVYWLVNVNNGLVLDVSNASADNAAPIIVWQNNGGANQKWRTQAGPNGSMMLVNVNSGKCLDVIGQSKDMGAGLQQYDCNGNGQPNQLWWFNAANQGSYSVVNVNSGLVLDVLGQSKDPGAAVDQWANWSGANQMWWLQPAN